MVKKAVITAAGKGTRQYPATNTIQKEMFPLVDRDGITKPTLQLVVEEAVGAGVEEVAIIIQPEIADTVRAHFQGLSEKERPFFTNKEWGLEQSRKLHDLGSRIFLIYQQKQEGFGHAVFSARQWVGNEPFLLMLGDHVHVSKSESSCAAQLVNIYDRYQKSIFAVKQTPAQQLYLFGTVDGRLLQTAPPVYQVTQVVEKPGIEYAREKLRIPELPVDTFLTFFGLYVFTPAVFEHLDENIKNNDRERGEFQLTTAQGQLCAGEGALAMEIDGLALDIGTPLGYVETMLSLAAHGRYGQQIKNLL